MVECLSCLEAFQPASSLLNAIAVIGKTITYIRGGSASDETDVLKLHEQIHKELTQSVVQFEDMGSEFRSLRI